MPDTERLDRLEYLVNDGFEIAKTVMIQHGVNIARIRRSIHHRNEWMSNPIGLSFRRPWQHHFAIVSYTTLQPNIGIGGFYPNQSIIGTRIQLAIFAFAQRGDIAIDAGALVFHHRVHAPYFVHDGQSVTVDSARQIPTDHFP